MCLHLSNLQKVALHSTPLPVNGQPNIISTSDARIIYTTLNLGTPKIEELLTTFGGGGLTVWAPDVKEQLPRILNAVQKLFDKGISVQIQMLIPFTPLPNCHTAQDILDLWGHPILHQNWNGLTKEVSFLREATRCVVTRNDNPMYVSKNILSVLVQGGAGGAVPDVLSMRIGNFISEPLVGDFIYIDCPQLAEQTVRHAICMLSTTDPNLPVQWRNSFRSRGCTSAEPRKTIIGFVPHNSEFETRAICKKITIHIQNSEMTKDRGVFVGRQSLFSNKNAIIADASMNQMVFLRNALGEVVLVSPHRAVVLPWQSAEQIVMTLSEGEELHTVSLRHKRSGPRSGQFFAKAKALREHVSAKKASAFASRQPPQSRILLQQQIQIEVLDIDSNNYGPLPGKIMERAGNVMNKNFIENPDFNVELAAGEWRAGQRDGHWNGKILLQCAPDEALGSYFNVLHGRCVCTDGMCRTIDVSSPTVENLAATVMSGRGAASLLNT